MLLVGIGAALQVFPKFGFLLVAGGPVVLVHHAHNALGDISCSSKKVHPLIKYNLNMLSITIGDNR